MNSAAPRRGLFAVVLAGLSGLFAGSRSARQSVPSSSNPLRWQLFNPPAAGAMKQLERDRGHPPHLWGTSRPCAQMRRKNKLRSIGISGQRI